MIDPRNKALRMRVLLSPADLDDSI